MGEKLAARRTRDVTRTADLFLAQVQRA